MPIESALIKPVVDALMALLRRGEQANLKRNAKDQETVNSRVDSFEKRITARYNALDRQMSTLNGLNAYISQQVTAWNKSSG